MREEKPFGVEWNSLVKKPNQLKYDINRFACATAKYTNIKGKVHAIDKSNVTIEAVRLERERIARDLHDGIGQELSAIHIYIQSMKSCCENRDLLNEGFENISKLIQRTIVNMQCITNDLTFSYLESECLIKALEKLFVQLNTSQKIRFSIQNMLNRSYQFQDSTKMSIYHLVQEFCNNAIKHSQATHVHLTLISTELGIECKLMDNGKGFDEEKCVAGRGLGSIKKRLQELTNNFLWESQVGKGSKLIFTIHA